MHHTRREVLCEPPLRVATERVNVNPFHRALVSLVVLVHPTTSARLAQIGPVGGLVTSAEKLIVDQRLQKQRAVTINSFR